MNVEKVDLVVIGAGWYGLIMAKTYLELHPSQNVVLLDSASSIGGVWATERLYPGLKSNNMLGTYEYPDFPMDEETFGVRPGQFIPGTTVHEYLRRFAEKFDIQRRIRFSNKVESAEKEAEGWALRIRNGEGSSLMLASRLVIAAGNTSSPFLPSFKGSEAFEAPLFHVKDLQRQAAAIRQAKEIVVLGGTKSAWDAAYACAIAGGDAQVHMVIRESGHGPIWMSPPYVTPLKKWLEKLVQTRLLTFFSPCVWGFHDGYVGVRNFFHRSGFGRKVVDTFWWILGNDLLTLNGYDKHPATAKLKPWTNPMFIASGLGILNYDQDFFELVRSGKIKVHIADVQSLGRKTVYLSDGERLNADALICSTGWKHHPPIDFLPAGSDAKYGLPHHSITASPLIQRADEEIFAAFPRLREQPPSNPKLSEPRAEKSDSYNPYSLNVPYNLYKFMVPPNSVHDRTLGFAGVPMQLTTAMVATIQALWLSAYFDGKIPLPASDDEIVYESTLHSRFGRWRYPAGHGAHFPDFAFDALPYCDMLLQQLGLKSHRKNGQMGELFQPYGPEDYRCLTDEWRALQKTDAYVNGSGKS